MSVTEHCAAGVRSELAEMQSPLLHCIDFGDAHHRALAIKLLVLHLATTLRRFPPLMAADAAVLDAQLQRPAGL